MALAAADHVAHHGDLLGMTSKVIGAAGCGGAMP
jgi:hypothetical protein